MADQAAIQLEGVTSYPVYYEDTDLSGFVYHTNYVKYFERAREDLVGISKLRRIYEQQGIHFVVRHMDVTYLKPARHGDVVEVRSKVEITRSPSHTYTQEAFVDGKKMVSAKIQIVALTTENKPYRMPADFVAQFKSND